MDKFVKNFIAMSIVYLALASVLGVFMMVDQRFLPTFRFVHSHFMLLGWVSMMIYGVGYHILPRFAGKLISKPGLAMFQFWISNIGLVGMVVFYTLISFNPDVAAYKWLVGISGSLQVLSSVIFFYLMFTTLFTNPPQPQH